MPENTPPQVRFVSKNIPRKPKKARAVRHETAIWDGLIVAPRQPESGLGGSLLYPLRGATGVAGLVILPPLLGVTSWPIIASIEAIGAGQSMVGVGIVFLGLPALLGFLGVFGFTLMYLGRVAASSAVGEVRPPRWPDWELSPMISGLGRWAWAGFTGLAFGAFPATAYWVYCGDVDLFDVLILIELSAVGAAYALMALLASILHEDLLAANPLTVSRAICRSGLGYLAPCLVAGLALSAAWTFFLMIVEVRSVPLAALLFWLFWVLAFYEAMVVFRVLGLFYFRRAGVLGWFRGRTNWGI